MRVGKRALAIFAMAIIVVGVSTSGYSQPESGCAAGELGIVYFDFDGSSIRSTEEDVIEHVFECLAATPDEQLRIEAHTEERGHRSWNLLLSETRAEAIRTFLEHMGADLERIQTFGFGEGIPAAEGHSEAAWRVNRRAEFHWSSETQCTLAEDCPAGHSCVDGTCQNTCTELRAPCDNGWFCNGTMCVECLTDDDCMGHEICTEERLCIGCVSDTDCADGSICFQGQCSEP